MSELLYCRLPVIQQLFYVFFFLLPFFCFLIWEISVAFIYNRCVYLRKESYPHISLHKCGLHNNKQHGEFNNKKHEKHKILFVLVKTDTRLCCHENTRKTIWYLFYFGRRKNKSFVANKKSCVIKLINSIKKRKMYRCVRKWLSCLVNYAAQKKNTSDLFIGLHKSGK